MAVKPVRVVAAPIAAAGYAETAVAGLNARTPLADVLLAASA